MFQLGLDKLNDDRLYMKPSEESYRYIDLYRNNFLCIDEEDRWVRGNFNSETASVIIIRLNKCHGKDYCKSDEEIT